jgi:hypothetical protein
MRKLTYGLCCLCLIYLCGCQKTDCQTFIQGAWVVVKPNDTSYIAMDSAVFYKGDSMYERYKFRSMTDTTYHYHPASYYISDQCDEIDFNGINTWDSISKVVKYQILQITSTTFQIRSRADSVGCTSCIVYYRR